MSLGHLLWELTPTHRSIVRNLEQLSRKVVNAEAAVDFNYTCLQEDLLPSYTDIYMYVYMKHQLT